VTDTGYSQTDNYSSQAKIHVVADANGGVALDHIEYQINGGIWNSTTLDASGNFTPSNFPQYDGTQATLTVREVSVSGAVGALSTINLNIDKASPAISVTEGNLLLNSKMIVMRGSGFTSLGSDGDDIKGQVDLSKVTYYDGTNTLSLLSSDVKSATINTDKQLEIKLTDAAYSRISGSLADTYLITGTSTSPVADGFAITDNSFLTDKAGNITSVSIVNTKLALLTSLNVKTVFPDFSSDTIDLFYTDGFAHAYVGSNTTTIAELEGKFKYDVNGVAGSHLTDVFRYNYTPNGIVVSVPTIDSLASTNSSFLKNNMEGNSSDGWYGIARSALGLWNATGLASGGRTYWSSTVSGAGTHWEASVVENSSSTTWVNFQAISLDDTNSRSVVLEIR